MIRARKLFGIGKKLINRSICYAILTAQQVSFNFSAFGKLITIHPDIVVSAAIDAADAASTASYALTYAAAYAVSNATAFTSAAINASANAASAAEAAIYATRTANIDIETEILRDLDYITNTCFPHSREINLDKNPLLNSSLWLRSAPESWQQICSHFNQSLLNLDKGFEVWVEWYKDRIDGVPLDREQEQRWLDIPVEVREQGVKAINAYFATLDSVQQGYQLQPLNQVRAILIGHGAAGKTSLIRRLHDEPVIEGEEEMTPGIEIREWLVPDTEIKARFWDFGGQVVSHSSHQFFLRERCLYVVVVDAGSEREQRDYQTANVQAEYWLEHIKAFGNGAPVMLVGNKCDLEPPVRLDMNALNEKYPNIVGYYFVSCTDQTQGFANSFKLFRFDLSEQLAKLGTHQMLFTSNQFEVLKQLRGRSRQQAFLHFDEFNHLCKEYEIGKVGLSQYDFLEVLDNLGEIIHFPDLDWSDAYVLNPRWLTYGVYTLVYSEQVKQQQGILCNSDVVAIMQAEIVTDENGNQLDYPHDKCRFIIDAMSKFGLCYRVPNNHSCIVIPDKLPEQQPDLSDYFNQQGEDILALEYQFTGLLPRSIMPNLIVARHDEIITNRQEKQLVWQHGVIIQHKTDQATARLQVDYQRRTLQFRIKGQAARDYLVILRDEIAGILDKTKGLSVTENVLLPRFARLEQQRFRLTPETIEKAPYRRLIKEARSGREITVSDAGNQYDLNKVLGYIMTEKQQKKEDVRIVNKIRGDAYIATQSAGKGNTVSGKITIHQVDQQQITEFQRYLTALMALIENHNAEFKRKAEFKF